MKINNYFSFIALLILILLQLQSCFSRISEQECPNYLNNSAINLFYENLKIAIDAKNTTFLVDNYLESELNAISTRFTELYKNADEKKSIQSFHDSIHDELYNDFISENNLLRAKGKLNCVAFDFFFLFCDRVARNADPAFNINGKYLFLPENIYLSPPIRFSNPGSSSSVFYSILFSGNDNKSGDTKINGIISYFIKYEQDGNSKINPVIKIKIDKINHLTNARISPAGNW